MISPYHHQYLSSTYQSSTPTEEASNWLWTNAMVSLFSQWCCICSRLKMGFFLILWRGLTSMELSPMLLCICYMKTSRTIVKVLPAWFVGGLAIVLRHWLSISSTHPLLVFHVADLLWPTERTMHSSYVCSFSILQQVLLSLFCLLLQNIVCSVVMVSPPHQACYSINS